MASLPSFFLDKNVDDTKYESLLEDLRAHDLLGPDELQQSESLNNSTEFPQFSFAPSSGPVSAPPGFDNMPPPGLAPTTADLEWARGQHEFQKLQEEYMKTNTGTGETKYSMGFGGLGLGMSLGFTEQMEEEEDSGSLYDMDETTLANFRNLGLDDDDIKSPMKQKSPIRSPSKQIQPPPPPKLPPPPPKLPPPLPTCQPPRGPPPQPGFRGWNQPRPPGVGAPPGWRPPPPPTMPMGGPRPRLPGPPNPPPGSAAPMMRPHRPVLRSQWMAPRDIQFVIAQQTKQLRSSDPFSDDYYYYCYVQKRTRHAMHTDPSRAAKPLPSWSLQHVRSVDPRDAQIATKSRQWEQENQVLGRTNKSSLYRPRELLNLGKPDAEQLEDTDSGDNEETTITNTINEPARVFSNKSWQKRKEVEKGNECLLALQDARHILDARGINPQQFHQQDENGMDPSLVALRNKTSDLLVELAAVLGVTKETEESSVLKGNSTTLYRILSVKKGRGLVCRALPLLHPSARYVLLPQVVDYFLANPSFQVDEQNDTRLSETLVVLFMYHAPLPPPIVFVDCLEAAMKNQNTDTLVKVLHDRPRAEALQALLQKGGTICSATEVDTTITTKWNQWQSVFVELASAIQQTT